MYVAFIVYLVTIPVIYAVCMWALYYKTKRKVKLDSYFFVALLMSIAWPVMVIFMIHDIITERRAHKNGVDQDKK